jgi:adenylate cyclase
MGALWEIRIYENQQLAHSEEVEAPVELGRQLADEPGPFAKLSRPQGCRIVIAPKGESAISRKHVRLEAAPNHRLRVENLSASLPVGIGDGLPIPPSAWCEISLPALLTLGKCAVRIQQVAATEPGAIRIRGLAEATCPPTFDSPSLKRFPGLGERSAVFDDRSRQLLQWLKTSMGVFQSAAGTAEFFPRAAQAVVEIIGLDTGRVLLLENDAWQTRAFASASPQIVEDDWRPSLSILNKVRNEKRTFWELPSQSSEQAASLTGVNAVVATPLLAPDGNVLGAVYGDRRRSAGILPQAAITELEAMLVELIASGVAAGMARMHQERAALAARVQFEQFFTRELSEQLALRPDLLEGQDAEVTLLFCDIRGFSRISERLGPGKTVQWIGDVMGVLSDCVLAHAGVLVDYIGDELVAMWGAPAEQPEHSRLACLAAGDMLASLPSLNARWSAALQEPMAFGIGINTGVARVGNMGSRHKFKYGPLGNTVNLASRVQGATKYLRSPILITGSTNRQIGEGFLVRRLCQVRVVNIVEPVELHELAAPNQPGWDDLKRRYETGLAAFERGDFRRAAQLVSALLETWPDDGPSILLLSRAADCLIESAASFDPIWQLPGK